MCGRDHAVSTRLLCQRPMRACGARAGVVGETIMDSMHRDNEFTISTPNAMSVCNAMGVYNLKYHTIRLHWRGQFELIKF